MAEPKRILLIENDPAALTYLSNMLRGVGYTVLTASSGKEGLIEAWRNRPDMLIIVPELPDLNGLEVIRKLRADPRTHQTKILLLSVRNFPQDILTGVQAGADEYIVKRPGADNELLERVKTLLPIVGGESPDSPAAAGTVKPKAGGKLITFLSAKGGTGTSTLCVNIAHSLAAKAAGKRVAVVDMVLPIGSLHFIVGVDTPSKNIIEATKIEARLFNPERLGALLTHRDDWGFDLLPGSPDPEAATSLRVDRLEAVITELRRMCDFVFIDLGRTLSRVSMPLIRTAARVVLVTSPDLATVALTKTVLLHFDLHEVRRHRIFPVLNRSAGVEGLSRPDLERELGMNMVALVPNMGGSFSFANNQHQPLDAKFPDDTVTYTLQDITGNLLNQLNQIVEEPVGATAPLG